VIILNFYWVTPIQGAQYQFDGKIWQFSINVLLYLRNDKDRNIVTAEDEWEVICILSNGYVDAG